MSNNFVSTVRREQHSNDTKTENSMPAYKSTYNACLDLFALGAAYRSRSNEDIISLFSKAYREDENIALRILAYLRDAREGSGERKFFRTCLAWLAKNNYGFNLSYIPEIGRWDDLLFLVENPISPSHKNSVFKAISDALTGDKPDALCAKWMPRKGKNARLLREYMGLYPREYRKLLVGLTKVVETQMCNRQWKQINYSHVPSVANIKYNKAFLRNDEERRREFLAAAKEGKLKINTSVNYPHTIVRMMLPRGRFHLSDSESLEQYVTKNNTAIAMWKQLPDVIGDGSKRILVCSDTSNSMRPPHSPTDDPFMISVALGIYFSEHLRGPFKNAFITFSKKPTLQYTEGDLYERLCQIVGLNPSNTNLEAIFQLVLNTAVKNRLSESEMPTDICIISDMEFDRATNYPKDDAFKMIRKMYADSGYDIPNLIFWNVNSRKKHHPIEKNSQGVILVSGASQNAIKAFLDGETTPVDAMLKAISSERYERFLPQKTSL